jgi:hypothetical protein
VRRGRAALAFLLLMPGCAGVADVDEPAAPPSPPATTALVREEPPEPVACRGGREARMADRSEAYGAVLRRRTIVHKRPDGRRLKTLKKVNVNGADMVLGVRGVVTDSSCAPAWYRVKLPMRPNGATGYVRADDVELFWVQTRLRVDLSARRIVLFRGGKRVLAVTAAVGSSETPTPTGRFYVNQILKSEDPTGPYGPLAIGISAFSPVLTGWTQGGPIAIHGTNQPWSIGNAVSNGCLRVQNKVVRRLFRLVPAGTPVVIRA